VESPITLLLYPVISFFPLAAAAAAANGAVMDAEAPQSSRDAIASARRLLHRCSYVVRLSYCIDLRTFGHR